MPFTTQELENIAAAALDFHMDRGKVQSQTIQDKPLLAALRAAQKTFPGGKELLTGRAKGDYTTTIQGFSDDDDVTYGNPANIKTYSYAWKEIHSGIKMTLTELKKDGISIDDTALGKGESRHSDREMTALANLLDDKIEDMKEGSDRGYNLMFWRDGTQNAKEVPGIRSFIVNSPSTAAIIGGLDSGVNTWWRNRALIGMTASTASDQNVVQKLQKEMRQLRRYGTPRHRMFAGSDFLDWFEQELRAKGNYTLEGWSKQGRIDASVADLAFKGIDLEYDPTLDDLGLAKYLYVLDMKAIRPMVMEGEDMKMHNPARPAEKYVLYRAMTWTGGLVCRQRNTSGVYSIA
mgnify:CR=1 FL=1